MRWVVLRHRTRRDPGVSAFGAPSTRRLRAVGGPGNRFGSCSFFASPLASAGGLRELRHCVPFRRNASGDLLRLLETHPASVGCVIRAGSGRCGGVVQTSFGTWEKRERNRRQPHEGNGRSDAVRLLTGGIRRGVIPRCGDALCFGRCGTCSTRVDSERKRSEPQGRYQDATGLEPASRANRHGGVKPRRRNTGSGWHRVHDAVLFGGQLETPASRVCRRRGDEMSEGEVGGVL